MRVIDRATLDASKRVKLPNGFLKVPARIARTGIQTYTAGELGITDRPPNQVLRIYRPPEEVFRADSMASFCHLPVTDDHPSQAVTTDNASQLQRGWSGPEVVKAEDQFLDTDLVISHAGLIAKVDGGKVEISNGYDCTLDWTAGKTPAGEAYDAIQRNIMGNHIAIVDAGRCGENCRIADSNAAPCSCGGQQENKPMADGLTTMTVDGIPVQVTDAARAVIDKMQNLLKDAGAKLEEAQGRITQLDAQLTAEKSAHEETRTKLTADLQAAKDAAPTGAALDSLVAARVKLVGDAKRLVPDVVTDGKTDAEIRQAVVQAKLGDAAKDKTADWFGPAFDALAAALPAQNGNPTPAATGTPAQDALGQVISQVQPTQDAQAQRDAAWKAGVDKLTTAWKTPAPAAA